MHIAIKNWWISITPFFPKKNTSEQIVTFLNVISEITELRSYHSDREPHGIPKICQAHGSAIALLMKRDRDYRLLQFLDGEHAVREQLEQQCAQGADGNSERRANWSRFERLV